MRRGHPTAPPYFRLWACGPAQPSRPGRPTIIGMPEPTAPQTMGSGRPLAQVYRRLAEADHADASPLYKHVALALSESDQALRAIEAAPVRKRNPTVILAALHDLALAGRAPALAAAYAEADGDGAAGAAIDTLLRMTGAVADIAVRRTSGPTRPDATSCSTRPSRRQRDGQARRPSG
jgi:hypothetical protein